VRTENHWPRRFATGAAVFAIILGTSVLIGWVTQTLVLVQVLPDMPFMVKNTAASFLLGGVALLTVALKGPRWIIVLAAGLVCVVNSLTIIEYLFHVDFGTGRLLGPTNLSVRTRPPGRVAPLASVCFTLASVGLLLPPKFLFTRGAPFLGFIGAMIAAFGFASTVGTFGHATLTAFNSAIGFLVFGLGVVSLAWDAEGGPASSPPWLLGGVAIAAIAATVGLWQAQVDTGRLVFDNLPLVVLIGGGVIATVFALTVYLAHRGNAQATALRQSEARLHRTEAFLLEAQVLSATGSFSLNPVTGEHWWSDQTYRIFDVNPRTPPSFELMRARVHPDDANLLERALECAKRGQEFTTEFRLRMADGAVKYLHTVAHAIQVSAGEPLEFVGAVRDITYRRLSQQTLEKARSDLARVARATSFSALTASISHEVNQPLAGIMTNASVCQRMLATDSPNIEGARDAVGRMIRDGNRASDIITRLRSLFINKMPTTGPLDLNEAAQEVIALSLSELQRNRVVVHTDFCDELPPATGDRVQLQQVILNLILNASDAMHDIDDRPRNLMIRTERDDNDCVRLGVRDSGVGFTPHDADRVFEAFFTTKSGGMGIGLSVSRSIIETHGGRIWATANDGPGATFFFTIPHEPTQAMA
jgi:signal transduction histidine kinase